MSGAASQFRASAIRMAIPKTQGDSCLTIERLTNGVQPFLTMALRESKPGFRVWPFASFQFPLSSFEQLHLHSHLVGGPVRDVDPCVVEVPQRTRAFYRCFAV